MDMVYRAQQDPRLGDEEILPLVISDLQKRAELGLAKYKQPLMTHNGRNPLIDAYQEAMDLALYLRQAIAEATPAPERREVVMDVEADELDDPSLLIDSRTCDNCQHGYQFEAGTYGCALHMARLCKPSLVGKHWAPRYITRGRETA